MAADITNVELGINAATELTFSAGAASQTFEYAVADEKLLIVVRNDDVNTATVTLTAGDFLQNGYGDVVQAIATTEYFIFEVESGIIKDSNGEVTVTVTDAGGTVFTGSEADVKIAVIEIE